MHTKEEVHTVLDASEPQKISEQIFLVAKFCTYDLACSVTFINSEGVTLTC